MVNYSDALKNMVSFSEFNRGQAGKIFEEVKKVGAKIVVKNNNAECVLVSVDEYSKLLTEVEDMRLLLTAADRMDRFDGDLTNTFSENEVEKIFGIDTKDYEKVEIE